MTKKQQVRYAHDDHVHIPSGAEFTHMRTTSAGREFVRAHPEDMKRTCRGHVAAYQAIPSACSYVKLADEDGLHIEVSAIIITLPNVDAHSPIGEQRTRAHGERLAFRGDSLGDHDRACSFIDARGPAYGRAVVAVVCEHPFAESGSSKALVPRKSLDLTWTLSPSSMYLITCCWPALTRKARAIGGKPMPSRKASMLSLSCKRQLPSSRCKVGWRHRGDLGSVLIASKGSFLSVVQQTSGATRAAMHWK
eukprot:CAMPEP_0119368774 /NCGR_PEP_ID=MMETSP1334-20130426/15389_1 /TAXON_ID=127549 /ORGANISM="Calcidiscus leptoporus, Strain RCC1130" /LENGTH=249 /DNA_ID=CAMNT_0007385487 /DNA_START=128 /DNA_END=874 /DNA_ORIENTATION=-